MDNETEKYYQNMIDLFQTQGWKQFVEESELHISALNHVLSVPDATELNKRQGKLEVLYSIVNLEDQVDNVLTELRKDTNDQGD